MKLLYILITCCLISCNNFAQTIDNLLVSPANTIKVDDTITRKQILSWTESFQSTGNTLFKTHASAAVFPGHPHPGYKLVNVDYQLSHTQSSQTDSLIAVKYAFAQPHHFTFYSTGLYAPPGEKIMIDLPLNLAREDIWIAVSANTDHLFDVQENWRRMPIVHSEIKVTSSLKYISSPFGGLIYFMIKPYAPSLSAKIKLGNVINAIHFELGKTKLADWEQQLANNKAPWGEIASDKIILTLPDSTLQKIKDPVKTLEIWNKIVDAEYELSQLPSPFIRPLRLVVDEHMAAGAMHSGYPIMIHHSPSQNMLSLDIIADPEKLLQSSEGGANWGFFHEIGHNLQNWEWVFDGSTEVGCNFYSLYVFDQLLGNRNGAHSMIAPEHQNTLMTQYFSDGARYEDYQKEPFLGLIPFMQLQKQFGWDIFKKVFRSYIQHPDNSLDYNNDPADIWKEKNTKKINLLVQRFSEATKTNLVPFFKAWGIPVSDLISKSLINYKSWIPEELKPYLALKK